MIDSMAVVRFLQGSLIPNNFQAIFLQMLLFVAVFSIERIFGKWHGEPQTKSKVYYDVDGSWPILERVLKPLNLSVRLSHTGSKVICP